jgi:hypothetical protein
MDQLHVQVARARRRLLLEQFLGRSTWCLLATFSIATIAIALPRIFVIEGLPLDWDMGWLLGALVGGLLGAVAWTIAAPRTVLDAAIEIDRRFELRERVASSLSLSTTDFESEAGRAVVNDASRAISRVDVGEGFRIRLDRRAWWPIIPAAISLLLVAAFDNRIAESSAKADRVANQQNDKKNIDSLRERIAAQKKQVGERDLPVAEEAFKQVDEALRDLNQSPDADRTKRVVKLNDLKQQLEDRRQELGAQEELKKQLDNLKNLGAGPAEKAAQAMKEGNWDQAKQEIEKLKNELAKGNLSEKTKQDLANQIEQMQKKLEAAASAHQQAMDDLKKQIDQQKQQGNMAKAGELQQKLDQLQKQQPQMDKLQQMAQQMGAMQQALQQGDNQKAADAMANLAQQLDQMAKDAQQMKALDQMMNNLEMAKDMMACADCNGAGCEACQGMGMKMGMGQGKNMDGKPGMGMGEGRGIGPRPDEKNDTKFRDTRVRQNVGRGGAVFGGMVQGPNIKGDIAEAIKEEMAQIAAQPADPLTAERLPSSRRQHAEEYMNKMREGE